MFTIKKVESLYGYQDGRLEPVSEHTEYQVYHGHKNVYTAYQKEDALFFAEKASLQIPIHFIAAYMQCKLNNLIRKQKLMPMGDPEHIYCTDELCLIISEFKHGYYTYKRFTKDNCNINYAHAKPDFLPDLNDCIDSNQYEQLFKRYHDDMEQFYIEFSRLIVENKLQKEVI